MSIWAISDLHLSLARTERRERFAERWRDHADKLEAQWRAVISPLDLVLIPGDISMARNHRDLQADLAWLDRLPGTKVLAPGNHDGWWNGVERIRPLLRRSQRAVEGDAIATHGVIVCGTRGVPVWGDEPTAAQRAQEDRELDALDRALEMAAALREPSSPLYVLWHYPPFDAHGRPGPCVERLARAKATACVYGHLHAMSQWSTAAQGIVQGIRYACVAADSLGFRPLRVDGARR